MKIAEPGSWLAGYILGVSTIKIFRKMGYARGKGEVKKVVSNWVAGHIHRPINYEGAKGFIDAILDSVN